jgi:hypothetical protein
MIQAWFPQRSNYVKTLLQDKFNDQKLEIEVAAKGNSIQPSLPLTRESGPNQTHRQAVEDVDFFPETVESPANEKMTTYLAGKNKLHSSDEAKCLVWWKVSQVFCP